MAKKCSRRKNQVNIGELSTFLHFESRLDTRREIDDVIRVIWNRWDLRKRPPDFLHELRDALAGYPLAALRYAVEKAPPFPKIALADFTDLAREAMAIISMD